MNHLYALCLLPVLLSSPATHAQIGLGGAPDPAAVLDLKSPGNDKVFMPPRLTSAQRKAIANPPAGSLVFDTDKYFMYLFDGQGWLPLSMGNPNLLSPNASRTLSDAAPYDFFGASVAISGDYALVGAQLKNSAQGAVYVFFRTGNTWTQQTQIIPIGATNQFGKSVAISGDYAIVGATAAAYIFMRNGTTWTQQQQIGYSNDSNGLSSPDTHVAISGDNAVVGAPEQNYSSGTITGKVYFYKRTGTNWSLQNMVTSSTIDNLFGASVAISGGYAVIGAPNANSLAGTAHIYWLRNVAGNIVWVQQTQLMSSSAVGANYHFGSSVALLGDYAVVGARGDNTTSGFGGRVAVFNRNGTTWSSQFEESSSTEGESFGASVAISDDYMIVGVPYKAPNRTGGAYIYKQSGTGWTRTRFVSETNAEYPENGGAVGIDNGMIIIGGLAHSNYRGKIMFDVVD